MTPALFATDGKPIQLGNKVGKGGEGEVFALHGVPGVAAKIYTVPDLRSREAKIRAMVSAGLAKTSPLIAFPLAIVRDGKGAFAGFTMKLVSKHQPLHELYSPGARKAAFPKADFRFLVRTAANTARAIAAAHASNCVIGDISHSGILVSEQATVALIDADSFQVTEGPTQHLCRVGVPEYTPPELQGRSLNVPRTPNHDAFGLALVCFQLLWMGRHPFAGRYAHGDMPFEKAISEFRFAYSRMRDAGMEPPPAVPTLADFPPQIANGFEQAFGPAGVRSRPTAKQWIALLEELEKALRVCSGNPQHHYPQVAKDCPWCRMERMQGILLFPLPHAIPQTQNGPSGLGAGEWEAIWRAIEAIKAPGPAPASPSFPALNLSPSKDAYAAKSDGGRQKIYGLVIVVVCLVLVVAAPVGAFLWLFGLAAGVFQFFRRETKKDSFARKARYIEERWADTLARWQFRAGDAAFARAKSALAIVKRQAEGLAAEERSRIQQYELKRRDDQLSRFLDRYRIRSSSISGVGPSRLTLLASYGIETAADVTPAALLRVPGFGPVTSRPLLEWRRSLEANFQFSSAHTPADLAAVSHIKAEIANKARTLAALLAQGPAELSRLVAEVEQIRRVGTPELQNLHQERQQIAADLRYLGLPPPQPVAPQPIYPPPTPGTPPTSPSPTPAPSPSPPPWPQPGRSSGLTCPRCGSAMVLRTARRGLRRGSRFYGCSRYPMCRGTRPHP